jgi:uncharacterized surface protein with fasciclin (FAS1) repeats
MPKRLLVLTASIAALALPVSSANAAASKDIVETAAENPKFSTLVSLVKKAKIVKTDVRCSNGIIHAINGVLLPPGS